MAKGDEAYLTDFAFTSDFVVTPAGDLATQTGLANYKDALFRRLITTPGSLIHRPNYGVGIKRFQNSINTIPTQQRLAGIIKEQLERDPRTRRVLGVTVVNNNTRPELVQIIVRVEAIGIGETSLTFEPFGEAA